ncbi:MAG: hypothetical protein ACH37Z_17270 [Anaerolineae bacterium]
MDAQRFARQWLWATTTGWWIGIPMVVVLALASDALGIEGGQAIVGLAMGASVGWRQRSRLRDLLPGWRVWPWASALGLALPFALADILTAAGQSALYSLPLATALGALTLGAWQARLLRPHVAKSATWPLACLLGWTLGAAAGAGAGTLTTTLGLRGITGALTFLALTAGGGPILGLVTGQWLRPRVARCAVMHGDQGEARWTQPSPSP